MQVWRCIYYAKQQWANEVLPVLSPISCTIIKTIVLIKTLITNNKLIANNDEVSVLRISMNSRVTKSIRYLFNKVI